MEVVISLLIVSVLATATGVSFIYYKVTHRPKPEISDYEKYKQAYISGDDAALSKMIESYKEE